MKNFLAKSALTVFSALVLFVLVEIGLQLTEYRKYIPFQHDANTMIKMKFYYKKDKTLGFDITPNFRDGEQPNGWTAVRYPSTKPFPSPNRLQKRLKPPMARV